MILESTADLHLASMEQVQFFLTVIKLLFLFLNKVEGLKGKLYAQQKNGLFFLLFSYMTFKMTPN